MPVLSDIGFLATCGAAAGPAGVQPVTDAALAWSDGLVRWVGPREELPRPFRDWPAESAGGRMVVPGLIDSHTHLAFGGWRAEEFAARLAGKSYLEIAREGGGIASTVARTRAMGTDGLLARCRGFARQMTALGVTTAECKSGYALETEGELRLLRVYRQLQRQGPLRIVPTFLGAHVVPPEHRGDRNRYLEILTGEMLPAVADEGLARHCDVFVEETAFTREEARRVCRVAGELGLGVKLHADQLSDGGGAALAAELGATSADHLEHASQEGIRAMAGAGVVAVSLPLAGLYLDAPPFPTRRFREAGVPVAVATDFNPGTAPSHHLPLAMMLACVRQRMTPEEVLKAVTLHAARAVGMEDRVGSLEPGKAADFAVIDAPDVNHWLYHFRANACVRTVIGGETVWEAGEGETSRRGDGPGERR